MEAISEVFEGYEVLVCVSMGIFKSRKAGGAVIRHSWPWKKACHKHPNTVSSVYRAEVAFSSFFRWHKLQEECSWCMHLVKVKVM